MRKPPHKCKACARGYHCVGRMVYDVDGRHRPCQCDCKQLASTDHEHAEVRAHIAATQFAVDHNLSVERAEALSDEVQAALDAGTVPTIAVFRSYL